MLLSAVSVLVVAQSSSEIPEGLMNNPVFPSNLGLRTYHVIFFFKFMSKFVQYIFRFVTNNLLNNWKFQRRSNFTEEVHCTSTLS